jgi:hypothetical protein
LTGKICRKSQCDSLQSWAPELIVRQPKNINGRRSFHSCHAGELGLGLFPKTARSLREILSIVVGFSCCRPTLKQALGLQTPHGERSPLAVTTPALGQRRRGLAGTSHREQPLGQDQNRGRKSSKLMGGVTAQRRAIQTGASEPPIPRLCRMGPRANRFRIPCISPNRTAPSGKSVSPLRATHTSDWRISLLGI